MRRLVSAALAATLCVALLGAAPARAAEEEGLFFPTLNFLLLLGALFYFARKPIRTWFADRRDRIRQELEEAAAQRREAEERYAKWQRRLMELERELDGIRGNVRERAESERESLLADARAAAERIRRDAANAVDREVRRARDELREEASRLAVELATGLLRENVTDGDRDRLLEEFIERIETPREARS